MTDCPRKTSSAFLVFFWALSSSVARNAVNFLSPRDRFLGQDAAWTPVPFLVLFSALAFSVTRKAVNCLLRICPCPRDVYKCVVLFCKMPQSLQCFSGFASPRWLSALLAKRRIFYCVLAHVHERAVQVRLFLQDAARTCLVFFAASAFSVAHKAVILLYVLARVHEIRTNALLGKMPAGELAALGAEPVTLGVMMVWLSSL
jgi:hypothetical protein